MNQPTVAAIMLVNGREEMVNRAAECFERQTYENKRLLLWCTGEGFSGFTPPWALREDVMIPEVDAKACEGMTVGALRNLANKYASHHYVKSWKRPEIFVHWDSDDWSNPNRLAEQVALLQSSGKQAVGYRDLLFWQEPSQKDFIRKTPREQARFTRQEQERELYGEAWLYSNANQSYCLGTSLCYWREVWERRPFQHLPRAKGGTGEDVEFLRGLDSLGVTSLFRESGPSGSGTDDMQPRMIASIHGDNTQFYGSELLEESTSWKRVSDYDQVCRELMAL